MARKLFSRWFSPRRNRRTIVNRLPAGRDKLNLEQLETRITPTVLDLASFPGQTGSINSAIFTGSTAHLVSGSGALDSFVRLDQTGIEQGYNTDARPYTTPNDAGNTATFNHSLQLSSIPIVQKGSKTYYEFVLDANQDSNLPYISLDELRLYVSSSNTLNSYDPSTGKLAGLSPVYDMDSGLDSSDLTYVKLNYGFNPGSGRPDLFVDIPTSDFGNDTSKYVYLYSKFGVQDLNDQFLGGHSDQKNGGSANDGFEEWARGASGPIQVSGSITTAINLVLPSGAEIPVGNQTVQSPAVVRDTSLINITAGSQTPTGTVTYTFTGTAALPTLPAGSSWTFVNSTTWQETVMVNPDGTVPESDPTPALSAGSYQFVAQYFSTNNPTYGTPISDVEPLTVVPPPTPGTVEVTTQIFDSTTNLPLPVDPTGTAQGQANETVYDQGTVTITHLNTPTATAPSDGVTYYFYDNATASGTPIDTITVPVGTFSPLPLAVNSFAQSVSNNEGPLTKGSYSFLAVYNADLSDPNYPLTASDPEPLIIPPPPKNPTGINTNADPKTDVVGDGVVLNDTATLTDTNNVGLTVDGTITFTLTAPDSTVVYTENDPVDHFGDYTTQGGGTGSQLATEVGTYYWSASFSSNNDNYTGSSENGIDKADEPVTVNPASPAINTSQQPASATVGDKVADKATVTGGYNPTGTVTFNLYSSATVQDGTTLLFTDTETLSGGMATSAQYTTTKTGTDYWVATYNGDSNNKKVSSGKADEPVTINPASPKLVTTASPNGTISLGTTTVTLSDSATLSGAYLAAGGTIKFSLYYNGGSGSVYTDVHDYSTTVNTTAPHDANGNGTYSSDTFTLSTTKTVTGNYYWSATFTPAKTDTNNNSASDDGSKDANEQLIVNKASPKIVTTATPTGTVNVGTTTITVSDSAVVTNGYYETGTLVFKLSGPAGFTTFTKNVTISGNNTYMVSTTISPSAPVGLYTWTVTYAGDGNNKSAVDQGGAAEQFTLQNVVSRNEAATLGFWANNNGQALLKTYTTKDGTTTTSLGTWLAKAWPSLFGNLMGDTGPQIASYYILAKNNSGTLNGNLYCQALCTALGVYVTTTGAGWNTSSSGPKKYGFTQGFGGAGLGDMLFNVGNNGASFGVANNTYLTVNQILTYLNSKTVRTGGTGSALPTSIVFYGGSTTLMNGADNVLDGINNTGDII